MTRIVLRGGAEERISAYALDGERVRLFRPDGTHEDVVLQDVELEATFRANSASEPVASAAAVAVELLTLREELRARYRVVEGSLRNVSAEELRSVVARVSVEDADGAALGWDEALVNPSSIAAGEAADFRVILRLAEPGGRLRVAFRHLLGAPLAHRDRVG